MRFIVFCVAVIVSIAVCPQVYSLGETVDPVYFDFGLPKNQFKDGEEVKVSFTWNVQNFDMTGQKRLTIKPSISNGAVEIYNAELQRYVGLADFNNQFPYLQKEMRIRFSGVQTLEKPAVFKFTVTDTLTDQTYQTFDKHIWGTSYYEKYSELLNENILKPSFSNEAPRDPVIDVVRPTDNKPRDPPKLYLWYLSPAIFLYGLLKSSNGFG